MRKLLASRVSKTQEGFVQEEDEDGILPSCKPDGLRYASVSKET